MIAFASKCWEKDWVQVAFGGFERKEQAIGYPFDKKTLIYNNGVPEMMVGFHYKDVEIEILDHYGLDSLNVYASGEMAAIWYNKDCEYLTYIQGDCQTTGGDWVTPAIEELETNPNVMVVSPLSEVNTWADEYGYDHYVSDQAFVIRIQDFLNPEVFHVDGVDPDYPDYGGQSFEAMVGKFLKKTGKKRKILTDFWTVHPCE